MAKAIITIPLGLIVIAVLLTIASELALFTAANTPNTNPTIMLYLVDGLEVEPAVHGVDKHYADYVRAVQACQGSSRKEWYLESNKTKLHTLCEGPDGKIYDLITSLVKGAKKLFENTGFPRASTWSEAREIMNSKLATKIRIETIKRILGL